MSTYYPGPGDLPDEDKTRHSIEDKTHYSRLSLPLAAVLLIAGIFTSTMPQPQVLGKIPLQNYLKNTLHVPRADMAEFFFLCGLFWYLKPIAGILTDAFPLFKTRRRAYMLLSAALAGVSWIGLGLVPKSYNNLLIMAIIVNLFMVMMSTVTGAFLVEVGQARGMTGRLSGVRIITQNVCTLIQGPLGGFLASGAMLIAAGANAVLVVAILPVAYLHLRERPDAMKNSHSLLNARRQMGILGRYRPFWMSIAFLLLFYFAPGFSTLQYYRQNDVLKLTQQQIGFLGSVSGLGGILAGLAYVNVARRIAIRLLLVFGVITAACGSLVYLFYNSYALAFAIDFQNGFFYTFCEVAMLDLAARGTPAGCEGLGYSLMMSARNFALFGADWLGAKFADTYHWPWSWMVCLNASTTAIVLILLPFMPTGMMAGRDGTTPNTENTGEPAAA
jgi:MFS family permease